MVGFQPSLARRKPSHFARSNVKVKKGRLRLSAKNLDPNKVSIQDKARGYDKFSTAIIKSKERSHYGYYEARAKSMKAAVCNAFWLYDPLEESVKYRGESTPKRLIFLKFLAKQIRKKTIELIMLQYIDIKHLTLNL